MVEQHDQQPEAGANPTSWWTPDERIVDEIELTIPLDAPPGPYTYRVGLYQVSNGLRLPCDGENPLCMTDYLSLPALPSATS